MLLQSAIEAAGETELVRLDPADDRLAPSEEPADWVETVFEMLAPEPKEPGSDTELFEVPLHEPGSPALTGTHLRRLRTDLRDVVEVGTLDGGTERLRFGTFRETPLARQLHYWHVDHAPGTVPDYYRSPLDPVEEPRRTLAADDEAMEQFFADLRADVDRQEERATEQMRERATALADALDRGDPARLGGDLLDLVGAGAVDVVRYGGLDRDGTATFARPHDAEHALVARHGDDYFHEDTHVALFPAVLFAAGGDADRRRLASGALDRWGGPLFGRVRTATGSELVVDLDGTHLEGGPRPFEGPAVSGTDDHPARTLLAAEVYSPLSYDRERKGLRELERGRLGSVLAGREPLRFDGQAADRSFDDALNQEQAAAVRHAMLADSVFPVHGPPGTGKTRVLVEVIRRAVARGESVLVCADSNQAVDNLVVGSSTPGEPDPRSLHAHGQHGSGEFTLARDSHDRRPHEAYDAYGEVPVADADVVASTNNRAGELARRFDLAVLDEATQSTLPSAAIPLSRVGRAVLAGDHRQLPPFRPGGDPPAATYGASVFEHVYGADGVFEGVGIGLRHQYRMHPYIASLVSRYFYEDRLLNGRKVPRADAAAPVERIPVAGSETRVDNSYANREEARYVAARVVHLLRREGVAPDRIGVITPYAGQRRLVRDLLAESGAGEVVVDTVDSFQGSEIEFLLVSLVRTGREGTVGFMGTEVDGRRRLNVALSRARRSLTLVGDFDAYAAGDHALAGLYDRLWSEVADMARERTIPPEFVDRLLGDG
jgi:hypothetical protein